MFVVLPHFFPVDIPISSDSFKFPHFDIHFSCVRAGSAFLRNLKQFCDFSWFSWFSMHFRVFFWSSLHPVLIFRKNTFLFLDNSKMVFITQIWWKKQKHKRRKKINEERKKQRWKQEKKTKTTIRENEEKWGWKWWKREGNEKDKTEKKTDLKICYFFNPFQSQHQFNFYFFIEIYIILVKKLSFIINKHHWK